MDRELIVSILFGLLGLGMVGAGFLTYLKSKKIAEAWPTTNGRVTGSEVIESGVQRNRRYRGQVQFEYEVGGVAYSSDTVTTAELLNIRSRSRSLAEKKVAAYPVNAVVQVFYDPADPKRGVLEHQGDWSLAILGGIVIVIAILFSVL